MVDLSENNAILNRIKEVLKFSGHGSEKELADYLGISPAVIANWRTRTNMDWPRIKKKLTLDQFIYAFTGISKSEEDPKAVPGSQGFSRPLMGIVFPQVEYADIELVIREAIRLLTGKSLDARVSDICADICAQVADKRHSGASELEIRNYVQGVLHGFVKGL